MTNKPVYSLFPIKTEKGFITIWFDKKTGNFEIPIRRLDNKLTVKDNSQIPVLKFKKEDWGEVKYLLDEKSRETVEKSIMNLSKVEL